MPQRKSLKRYLPSIVRDYLDGIQHRLDRLEQLDQQVAELRSTVANLATAIDTILQNPRHDPQSTAGFNWQPGRKNIFAELIEACRFDIIVETGTWVGNTTGYMASKSGLPVLSTEVDARFHSLAKMRLADLPNVTLVNMDSRAFLNDLTNRADLENARLFFYLDAHWYSDLPLEQEVETIARRWKTAVVLIDDFQVPGDEGYGYDDFGEGKELTLDYLGRALSANDLVAFFPSIPSVEEGGLKRGCVVIVRNGPIAATLDALPSLRRHNIPSRGLESTC